MREVERLAEYAASLPLASRWSFCIAFVRLAWERGTVWLTSGLLMSWCLLSAVDAASWRYGHYCLVRANVVPTPELYVPERPCTPMAREWARVQA